MALSKSTFLVGSIIGLLIGAVLGYTLAFSRLDGLESQISMLKEQVTDLESQLVGNLTLISQLQTVVIALVQGTQTSGQGTISGKVTIGPLCPVEPCPDP
ncbi:MAG: hypothetical protein ACETWE_12390, partial [Candidatus Bathyarchaeia archaeon]